MTNKLSGQVDFELDGVAYGLKLGMNAICEIEAATNSSINELQEQLNNPSKFRVTDLRILFFACLKAGGSKVETLEDAGNVLDRLGLEKGGQLLGEATQLAFPGAAVDEGKT